MFPLMIVGRMGEREREGEKEREKERKGEEREREREREREKSREETRFRRTQRCERWSGWTSSQYLQCIQGLRPVPSFR